MVASGYVFDPRDGPSHRRSCSHPGAALMRDGTLVVTFRAGSARDSADGHDVVFASTDGGDTWEHRHDGFGRGAWEGTAGEVKATWIAETAPGELTVSGLWIDRSDPARP